MLLLIPSILGIAQNLVVNPSFEDTYGCPPGLNYLDAAKEWTSPLHLQKSTPDLFYICSNDILSILNIVSLVDLFI